MRPPIALDHVDEGRGTPVVLSHGGSSDARYWEPQRRSFAQHHRVVTYSRRADPSVSMDDHTDELLAVLAAIGKPAHLVGFSAPYALRAALREPARIRSLTLIEPNVPSLIEDDPEGRELLAWWRAENERIAAHPDLGQQARLWFELVNNRGPGTFDEQPAGLRQMWLDRFGRTQPGGPPPAPIRCADLAGMTRPALVVDTEHGMRYSRRIAERLAECLPNAQALTLAGATHFVSYQEPDLFDAAVLTFLAAVDSSLD